MSSNQEPLAAHNNSGRSQRVNLDAGGNSRQTTLGRTAYLQALDDGWADHRRLHHEGRRARALYDGAREAVASVLGARTDEIFFAPSPTAAFHAVIPALLAGHKRKGNRVVASRIERAAVLNALEFSNATEQLVAVDERGLVNPDEFSAAVAQPGVAFAALQQANHEVATLQPLDRAREACTKAGVPLLVDATASLTHVAPPTGLWDALIASPADWGGGQGVGVLALKSRARARRVWPEDQDAWFPGGASLPAIFAAAVTLQEAEGLRKGRAQLHTELIDSIRRAAVLLPDTEVLGDPINRLPHMCTFSCLYVDSEALMAQFDALGFAVGSGSACTSTTLEPSHVLAAMGVLTHGNVRVTLDWDVTREQVGRFIQVLPHAVARVRGDMGVTGL